jgi:hypothetical protein
VLSFDAMITGFAWLWKTDGMIIGDSWLWSIYSAVKSSCLAAMVMAWTRASLYYISSRVLPEKLRGPQSIKNFPLFYGNPRFVHIVVFKTARLWSLSWASWFQSTPPISIPLIFILILFSNLHIGLHSDIFRSCFLTKRLCEFFFSPVCSTFPTQLDLHFIALKFCNYG